MKKKKIIILSILVIFIIAMICGVIWYFNNRNSNYKPNGKLNYDTVLVNEETNPYYQVGFADYVFMDEDKFPIPVAHNGFRTRIEIENYVNKLKEMYDVLILSFSLSSSFNSFL